MKEGDSGNSSIHSAQRLQYRTEFVQPHRAANGVAISYKSIQVVVHAKEGRRLQ